ncbi:MAG: imelysin family protein [Pseudomonadota bacterium]
MRLALAFLALSSPAFADVSAAIDRHILPRHAALATATQALAAAAAADCTPAAVRPAYQAAYDAWISVGHIQFGPIEDQGLSLAMAFWPDPKDSTGKALARLTTSADAIVDDPAAWGEVSAAAQGFTALERMLYDPQPEAVYACRLTRAIAAGLAQKSDALATAWPDFATLMRSAGEAGNGRFQSTAEAQRALYTALSTGLEFLHDERLGRPLGTFDRPRPRRAEARRSARALRHISLSLAALEELATVMYDGDLTETKSAFAAAKEAAARIDDPALAGVADPLQRIRVEALQRSVRDIQNAVNTEIGKPLGITAGFNALDGD